jgi:hypothetical protein
VCQAAYYFIAVMATTSSSSAIAPLASPLPAPLDYVAMAQTLAMGLIEQAKRSDGAEAAIAEANKRATDAEAKCKALTNEVDYMHTMMGLIHKNHTSTNELWNNSVSKLREFAVAKGQKFRSAPPPPPAAAAVPSDGTTTPTSSPITAIKPTSPLDQLASAAAIGTKKRKPVTDLTTPIKRKPLVFSFPPAVLPIPAALTNASDELPEILLRSPVRASSSSSSTTKPSSNDDSKSPAAPSPPVPGRLASGVINVHCDVCRIKIVVPGTAYWACNQCAYDLCKDCRATEAYSMCTSGHKLGHVKKSRVFLPTKKNMPPSTSKHLERIQCTHECAGGDCQERGYTRMNLMRHVGNTGKHPNCTSECMEIAKDVALSYIADPGKSRRARGLAVAVAVSAAMAATLPPPQPPLVVVADL